MASICTSNLRLLLSCSGSPVSFILGEPRFKSQRWLMLHRLYFGLLIMDAVSGGNGIPG